MFVFQNNLIPTNLWISNYYPNPSNEKTEVQGSYTAKNKHS